VIFYEEAFFLNNSFISNKNHGPFFKSNVGLSFSLSKEIIENFRRTCGFSYLRQLMRI
jgi:hypothetical protein